MIEEEIEVTVTIRATVDGGEVCEISRSKTLKPSPGNAPCWVSGGELKRLAVAAYEIAGGVLAGE